MEEILKNKKLREEGKFIGIPLYKIFPKLVNVLPSLPRGSAWMISANSGIGKSKFARFLLKSIYSIYKNYKNRGLNPGFKPRFLIFLTEESKSDFKIAMITSLIKEKYGYSLDKLKILSMAKNPLSDKELGYIHGIQEELTEILSFMDINDTISNPYGIYKYCRSISDEIGIHYYCKIKDNSGEISKENYKKLTLTQQKEYKYSKYIPNNEEDYVIVLVDNLNNLSPEKNHNGDLRLAIMNWSRDYMVKQLLMHWKWTVINVIQQAMDTEKKQFTNSGKSITEKLIPTIAGLGNSKESARDTHIFTGLFKPAKYGIEEYKGYDTTRKGIGLNFISAIFEKNRIGTDSFEIPLFFDGATERFVELDNSEIENDRFRKARKKK
jgi:hypothetical protein